MPQTKPAIPLTLAAGALCLGMIVAMIFPVVAQPFKRTGAHVGAASRQTTLDDVWSVIPDRNFQISSAALRGLAVLRAR